MKIITIAASALLIATGIAVAGSDHGSNWDYPQPSPDRMHTSSMKKSNENVRMQTPATVYRPVVPRDESQGQWGNH